MLLFFLLCFAFASNKLASSGPTDCVYAVLPTCFGDENLFASLITSAMRILLKPCGFNDKMLPPCLLILKTNAATCFVYLTDLTLQNCDAVTRTLLSSLTRHRDKDAEFVTLCKSLHVTDLVCDHAWKLWNSVQDSMDNVTVCFYTPRKPFYCLYIPSLGNTLKMCLFVNSSQPEKIAFRCLFGSMVNFSLTPGQAEITVGSLPFCVSDRVGWGLFHTNWGPQSSQSQVSPTCA